MDVKNNFKTNDIRYLKWSLLQITDKLFRLEAPYGSDLAAIDIQRGRDHGLAPYNEYRVACGLSRAANFSDFSDVISFEVGYKKKKNLLLMDIKYFLSGFH